MSFNLGQWPTDVTGVPIVSPRQGSVTRTNAGSVAPGQCVTTWTSNGGIPTIGSVSPMTIPLGTILSTKNAYLTDISVTCDSASATNGMVLCQITVNGNVVWEEYTANTSPISLAGIESQDVLPAGSAIALVFTAGQWTSGVIRMTYDIACLLQ